MFNSTKNSTIACILIILCGFTASGCENANRIAKKTQTTPVLTPSPSPENREKENRETFWVSDISYIQKNNDPMKYNVSGFLGNCIKDIVYKTNLIDQKTSDGKKIAASYDYNKYDYKIYFGKSNYIIYNSSTDTFHFSDEKKIYSSWGETKTFWQSLIFNKENRTVDIKDRVITSMVQNINNDITGDHKPESIQISCVNRLSKDKEIGTTLKLTVNNTSYSIDEYEWIGNDWTSTAPQPKLSFLEDKKNIFSFKDYREFTGDNKTSDSDLLKMYNDNDNYGRHQLRYSVNDYDGDSYNEILSSYELYFHNYHLSVCEMYSFYRYQSGKIKNIQVLSLNPYDNTDKANLLIFYAFIQDYIEKITVNKLYGRIKTNDCPYYIKDAKFTMKEIQNILDQYVSNKTLKKTGDRYYFRF